MKTPWIVAIGVLALAACSPNVTPERGVGFDDFSAFELERAQREAGVNTAPNSIIPGPQVTSIPSDEPIRIPAQQTPNTSTGIATSELAQAGIGTGAGNTGQIDTSSDLDRTQGIDASPNNPAPQLVGATPSLSDEQNFDAVSGRETIESDAERRAAQAAARQQVEPTAVPDRPRNTGPNIVEYALNAPNVKGQEWYSRSLLSGDGRFQRNCARYATPDEAQRDFLARGGPERDRLGIDPDGDGFACGWDPAPFRLAVQN